MSRFSEWDGDEDFNNQSWFWMKRAQLALEGRRGRKALAELREALLALPEKRLISRALCTVNPETRIEREVAAIDDIKPQLRRYYDKDSTRHGLIELTAEQGEGVCAIGAYVWYQKVKAGMVPVEAFDALPTVADIDGGGASETAALGRDEAGLTFTLAWQLAEKNDSDWEFGGLSPEGRYTAFLAWIDEELAKPLLKRPAPRPKRERKPKVLHISRKPPAGQVEIGLGL